MSAWAHLKFVLKHVFVQGLLFSGPQPPHVHAV